MRATFEAAVRVRAARGGRLHAAVLALGDGGDGGDGAHATAEERLADLLLVSQCEVVFDDAAPTAADADAADADAADADGAAEGFFYRELFDEASGADAAAVVEVMPASGAKCGRCWKFDIDAVVRGGDGSDDGVEVCGRCWEVMQQASEE